MSETTKIRRPISAVQPIAEELLHLLSPACVRICIAGSLRRLRPEVADIELVAVPAVEEIETFETDLFGKKIRNVEKFNRLWAALDGFFKPEQYIRKGEKYRSFPWPLMDSARIQVDLFTATPQNWGNIFLIRTGSAEFSKHVVSTLRSRGYCSHEGAVHRLSRLTYKPDGDPLSTPTEEDVFKLAGIKYVAPAGRNW